MVTRRYEALQTFVVLFGSPGWGINNLKQLETTSNPPKPKPEFFKSSLCEPLITQCHTKKNN
jgi:hypothetical protein